MVFDDPLIHGVIQAMGAGTHLRWNWTSDISAQGLSENLSAFTGKNVPTPLRLAGRAELDPHNKGRRVEVEYIGDRAKALAWTSERKKQELGHEQQEDVKQLIQGIAK